MSSPQQVFIFDTTLRDGQQCPGAGMTLEQCLEYAQLAAGLGVDVLEAGFPAASKLDFSMVHSVAESLATLPDGPVVAALCQLRSEQVDRTIEALAPAIQVGKARLHVYLPVDPELMRASLGERWQDRATLLTETHDFVKRAFDAGCEVEFSPEGYSRQGENAPFVIDLIRAAVSAGARVINCPDTAGGACKLQGSGYFVEQMKRHAAVIEREFPHREVIWSVHCHNDFGLAVENSINGVFFGPARQIEGCINGVGERSGNAALEQCIMIIKHFSTAGDAEIPHLFTRARTEKIQEISDFVARHMLPRQPHWPIGGENAAKHSSGGHTNAILRNPLVYQAFDPAETGTEISLLFGPLSGGNHARSIIERHGYRCDENEKVEISQFIKDRYAERRKGITDEELIQGYVEYRSPVSIESFGYSRQGSVSSVQLRGTFFGRTGEITGSREGRDSALATLKDLVDREFAGLKILSYHSTSDGHGIEATSSSTILLEDGSGQQFEGKGVDHDIEISAMKALLDAVNLAYVWTHFRLVSHESGGSSEE